MTDAVLAQSAPGAERDTFMARLAIGLIQGIVLYFLYRAYEHEAGRPTAGFCSARS